MSNRANSPYHFADPVIRLVATEKAQTPRTNAFSHTVTTLWFNMNTHTPRDVEAELRLLAAQPAVSSVRLYTDGGTVNPFSTATYNRKRLDAVAAGAQP